MIALRSQTRRQVEVLRGTDKWRREGIKRELMDIALKKSKLIPKMKNKMVKRRETVISDTSCNCKWQLYEKPELGD